MENSKWVLCPVCGNKTRLQLRADTELKNFPLYCPKCKQESLIDAKDLQVTVIKEPDAEPMNRATNRNLRRYKYMKNTHICPKCNGSNILVIDGHIGGYGEGNLMVGKTILSSVKKDNFICCDCGYTEEWIRLEDIPKVRSSEKAHR